MNETMKIIILLVWLLCTPVLSEDTGKEKYIVIIKDDIPVVPRLSEVLRRFNLYETHPDVRYVYDNIAFQGFAAEILPSFVQNLGDMSDILIDKAKIIQPDFTVERDNTYWGLSRISHPWGTQGTYTDVQDFKYYYESPQQSPMQTPGQGVDIYIVDSGIRTDHQVFGNRARMAWSFNQSPGHGDSHGTSCASVAAGVQFGVASGANIIGIKIFDNAFAPGSRQYGDASDTVAGVQQVITLHATRRSQPNFIGSVVSMSNSLANDPSLAAVVQRAMSQNIHYVASAGNNNKDACAYTPAELGGTHGDVITVGSIDIKNNPAPWTNWGDCVDVYAPGVEVIVALARDRVGIGRGGGTSVSAPYVAGIVAYLLTLRPDLRGNVKRMKQEIARLAVSAPGGELVAYNGVWGPISQEYGPHANPNHWTFYG